MGHCRTDETRTITAVAFDAVGRARAGMAEPLVVRMAADAVRAAVLVPAIIVGIVIIYRQFTGLAEVFCFGMAHLADAVGTGISASS